MKNYAVGVGLIALACQASGATGSWQALAPLPEPNAAFVCGRVGGSIVVLGGTNWANGRKNWLQAVHAFDLETLQWTTLAPLTQPMAYSVASERGAGMIVAGGTTGEAPLSGALRVEPTLQVVSLKAGVATPSVLCAGGLVGDQLIFVGGTDSAVNVAGFRRDAFAWDVRTGEQRALPPYPEPAFGIGSAVVVGDELLVFGGCRFDAANGKVVNLTGAHAFSVTRNQWRDLRPMIHAARALTAVRLDDRHVYLAGGARDDPEPDSCS